MSKYFRTPMEALRYHVSGAIERGEKEPIVAIESVEAAQGYTVVSTEWTLFTEEQARNFGPDVIAGRCDWHDYGHHDYDGLIRARSTVND